MPPDFSKKTVDVLAKRAAYLCSNPDCRVPTVGPNSDPEKATLIGEAAHISGAREGAKRFRPELTAAKRAEITNGIWLCRNCHRLIDSDETQFPEPLLYAWRESHEAYVLTELGSAADRLRFEVDQADTLEYSQYPPIVRRITIDKPTGWQWRLGAELLRSLNEPVFRQLRDIRDRLYYEPGERIDANNMMAWIRDRTAEMAGMFRPFESLLERLGQSLNASTDAGGHSEIHHVCRLLQRNLLSAVTIEERLAFDMVPPEFAGVVSLMSGVLSTEFHKLECIPDSLDEVAELAVELEGSDESRTISKRIVFELPEGWADDMNRETEKALRECGLL